MRSFFLVFPLLGALVYAQSPTEKCQCPQVKCPGDDAVALCNCLNSRETLCKERCPDYIPTYIPCPIKPPIPSPSPSTPAEGCVCEKKYCTQAFPGSCYCENDNAQRCFEKCGGVKPLLQECPSQPTLTLKTTTRPKPTSVSRSGRPTSTSTLNPKPSHIPCGGGRGNYKACPENSNLICIKHPQNRGCGPECDGPGICVEDKMCGGFAGFDCDISGQRCFDDPRDDCDPLNGGFDCGGLCVWPQ